MVIRYDDNHAVWKDNSTPGGELIRSAVPPNAPFLFVDFITGSICLAVIILGIIASLPWLSAEAECREWNKLRVKEKTNPAIHRYTTPTPTDPRMTPRDVDTLIRKTVERKLI